MKYNNCCASKYALLLFFLIYNTVIRSQVEDSAQCGSENSTLLQTEITISIISINNVALYKPFSIFQNNNTSVGFLTGFNFGLANLLEKKLFSDETTYIIEYDLLVRGVHKIYKSFFAGIEAGMTYQYLTSKNENNNYKWNEKVGVILLYQLGEKFNLFSRTSGTFKKASTFGLGFQYLF